MTGYALRLENGTDTAPRMRMGDSLGLQHDGPLNTRSGLRNDGGGDVSVVEGSMGVQVTPFLAWVNGDASDLQAGYPFVLDATATLTLDDGDAALDRYDTIVVQIHEDSFDGSGETSAMLTVVKGTPGGMAPDLPDTTLALRDVLVRAGVSAGTGGLTPGDLGSDRRTYLSGGILPVSGAAERDMLPAVRGQAVHRADTGRLEVFNGTEWEAFKRDDGLRMASGTLESGSITGDGSWHDGPRVDFPTSFAGAPSVVLTSVTSYGGDVPLMLSFGPIDADGFTPAFKITRDVGSQTINWVAVGQA